MVTFAFITVNLDALAEHAVEPDDPTREVPNPAWAVADAKLRQAQADLDRLQADIEVTDRERRVTLAPMSSLHKTKSLAALCQELNQSETLCPGSALRLRCAIRET